MDQFSGSRPAASLRRCERQCERRGGLPVEQVKAIKDRVAPMIAYANRLHARMEQRDFLPDDPLLVLVTNAVDALHALWVQTRYLSCEHGVGRRRESSA